METTADGQDLTVVVHTEEIDLRNAKDFEAELSAAVEAALSLGVTRLLLDFEKVHFLDSGGVSTLIDAHDRLAEHHCRLELLHAQRPVVRTLDVLGLQTTFAVA